MRAKHLTAADLAHLTPDDLLGAIVLAPIRVAGRQVRKGTRLDPTLARALLVEAPEVRVAWADSGDLHEDEAASRLAHAAAGPGVVLETPRQSRIDLRARTDGVLSIQVGALTRLNAIDPLEIFTLYHGQTVTGGQVVASVKVAPHIVAESIVLAGVAIARDAAPLVEVRPFRTLEVAAIVLENISRVGLAQFEAGARTKVESLGSRFLETTVVGVADASTASRGVRDALRRLVLERAVPLILVGGVSAGDPLSPFYGALEELGGRVLRRGVPAHPGSMIWLAELDRTRFLGLPRCGMFTLATAADLVLARLLTGEALDADSLAGLAHGGLLVRDMRFRFPSYARDLPAADG